MAIKINKYGIRRKNHYSIEVYKDYNKILKVINTNINFPHYVSTGKLIENFRKKHTKFCSFNYEDLYEDLYNKNLYSPARNKAVIFNKKSNALKVEVIGKTKIKVSGKLVDCTLKRNKHGNLELDINNESKLFPDGTVIEKLNEEITITKFIK
jgi:hypothetical protein